MPTQRKRIEALVGGLDHEKSFDLSTKIRRVVAEAQNEPPLGAADGSLNVDTWEAARDFADALHDLGCKLDRLQKKLATQMVEDAHKLREAENGRLRKRDDG